MERIFAQLLRVATWMFYGILAYVPLHIFLSTWIGTSFGILEPLKVLKDIVLVVGFLIVAVLSLRKPWLPGLMLTPFVGIIVAYATLTMGVVLVRPVQADAEALGLVYNLRFLVFFLYALLLARLIDFGKLWRCSVSIVLIIGVLVATLGVVQYTVLPDDALTHVGYSRENGVLPAFHIDDKPDLERVMSTLRDPNSLGSYLIIIASLLGAALATLWRHKKARIVILVSLFVTLSCLVFTFSRSAWLGMFVAVLFFVGVLGARWVRRGAIVPLQTIVSLLLVIGSLATVSFLAARDSYFVQNVVFHADTSTTLEDPNELRLRFWGEALDAAREAPFGHGVGTAGLASIRNTEQGTVLTENYYLQVLYEVGVVGLLLFVAILVMVAWQLILVYRASGSYFALALLSAFAGLLVTNFLVHIWANEAVAYTFWGLVGLAVLIKHK